MGVTVLFYKLGHGNESLWFAFTTRVLQKLLRKNFIIKKKIHYFHKKLTVTEFQISNLLTAVTWPLYVH